MTARERTAWDRGWTRLRERLGRLLPSSSARASAVLGMVAVAAAAIALAARLIPASSGASLLAGGRRFYSDDLIKICRALDELRIEYRQDDHRIEVAPDQIDQATAALAKLDIGRKPIDELRGSGGFLSGLLETSQDRKRKEQLARERILESLISQQDGVAWSLVSLHELPARPGSRTPVRLGALVYLETEGDQRLPARTLQLIPSLLAGYVPELAPHSITVMDRGGRRYLDPNDPSLGEISRNQAVEEELADKIRERLDWIKGVRVLARVSSPAPAVQGKTGFSAQPAGSAAGEHQSWIVVNQPASLEAVRPEQAAAGSAVEGGRILVSVPRSFYLGAMVDHSEQKEPSVEELKQFAGRTEAQIRQLVGLITTGRGDWKVDVEMIPDKLPVPRLSAASSPPGNRRFLDWGFVATIAAGVAIVTATGAWIRAARRPGPPSPSRPAWRADPPQEHAARERVRELVRRDPEAAASVLERWLIQGDSPS